MEEIDLEAAEGLPTLAPAATQDPNAALGIGSVLGGTPVQAILFADQGSSDPTGVTSVRADFVPFGSAGALRVQASVNGTKVVLELPDDDASGVLRVAIAWTGACGDATSAGELALRVLHSSVAEGCPTTEDELVGSAAVLADETILFGTVDVPLAVVSWNGRWLLASGVTDGPQFEPWDRAAIIEAAPGTAVVVRESTHDLELLSVRTWFYERAVVEAYLEPESTTELSTYGSDRTNANASGRVRIPAPLEVGSYVFESQGTWQTSCLSLVTYNAVSVEVR